MDDVIRLNDQFYIRTTSPLTDDRTRVLKHGDTFAVFDRYGDIHQVGKGSQGLYHEGTRFLSRFELRIDDERPMLLSSTIKEDNALLAVDLTNPNLYVNGCIAIPRGSLHLFRAMFLWQGACYEHLRVTNFGSTPIEIALSVRFDADFADIFEVRGTKRERRGRRLNEVIRRDSVQLVYKGLDGVARRTRLHVSPRPAQVSSTQIVYRVPLQPQEETSFFLTVSCESVGHTTSPLSYDQAFFQAEQAMKSARARECEIHTSNQQFNAWLNRSQPDLHMLMTETPQGLYPCAGIPWYSTPFGRDGIITALEYLWVNPEMAKGVLAFLAYAQATEVIPEQDAEPGKILHEVRKGEMAALGEIPFTQYYGSVDATPLFVMLAGAYYERTADRDFLHALWPHVERALCWIDTDGDPDGDGFVEYHRQCSNGLVNQGWKDSGDAIFHADGSSACGPIALCEVQGYVYAAKQGAARLAQALGQTERADELLYQAETLRTRFDKAFWCEEISTYALALDGDKRACKVRTSNAGHCLFTGIATQEHAQRVAEMLLSKDLFSGWGVRTLGSGQTRYNPVSYHNGSIWPHDNALIAMGLAHYGLTQEATQIMSCLFDATLFQDLNRLPELFCGFVRRPGIGPSLYPVACAPQAWSAASVFLLLQASLGLHIDAPGGCIHFSHSVLPDFLNEVEIRQLKVGGAEVDLLLKRHKNDVGINVMRRDGPLEIVVTK